MKKFVLLSLLVFILSDLSFGQYYIGNTADQIFGFIQEKAIMITKNYDQNGQLILSWVEHRDTKWIVDFDGEISYKTYIVPLYEETVRQWYDVINGTLPKAEGRTNVWISYTKNGTFQIRFVYYPGSTAKCFEITRTNQY